MTHVCAHCGTTHADCGHDHGEESELFVVRDAPDVDLLRMLITLADTREALDADEALVVEELRRQGVSWAKIAHRLRVSTSTLHRQYAYLQAEDHD